MFHLLSMIAMVVIPYGNILTLYRDRTCTKCEEIENILKSKNLKINFVNCDEEETCPKLPSLTYTKNRVPISTKSDLTILDDIIQDIQLTSLEGPWLILFYKEKESNIEKHLLKAALDFPDLNVGRIKDTEVPKRHEIAKYPSIIAFSSGLKKTYEYSLNNISLANFIKTLLENFNELTLDEFYKIKTHVFFIVFYQNEKLANYHFLQIAHNYKFTARFYKSSDKSLLKLAEIDFLKFRSPQKPSSDVLVLSVYKRRRFHKLIITKFNEDIINEWIFHSHYSHLTRVNNENFNLIFNAFKPVILLLTRKEQLCEDLELVSEELHEVKPFMSYLFAVVDVDNMIGFVDTLLPGINIPNILVYDPSKFHYYVSDKEIKNVKKYVNMLIDQFEKQKLKTWPRKNDKNRNLKIYAILIVLTSVIIIIVKGVFKTKIKIL